MYRSVALSNFSFLTNLNVQKSCLNSSKNSLEPWLRFIAFGHMGFIYSLPPLVYTYCFFLNP